MPFTDMELARRIERADCRLLEDTVTALASRSPDRGAQTLPVGTGVAVYTTPGSPLNRIAGLGFAAAAAEGEPALPTDAELDAAEALFLSRGEPVQIALSSMADPRVPKLLTTRGYRLVGFENVSGLALANASLRTGDPSVQVDADAPVGEWLDALVAGFLQPDTQGLPSHEEFSEAVLREAIRDFTGCDGMRRYIARAAAPAADDAALQVAGAGSFRVTDGIAQLCGAATRAEFRRRGVQTALLARRLADAAASGADVAVVMTQPGSKSQENMHRWGFEILFVRAVLMKEPAAKE
ncbi:MAG: GNAT family N-acetyltransferase [Planctomycetota bacterium]